MGLSRRLLPLIAALLWPCATSAGPELVTDRDGDNSISPLRVEATQPRIASLRTPPGFRLSVFARGLGNIRMFAVAPDGFVYVTRRAQGDVLRLRDANADGVADEIRRVVVNLPEAHGIAVRGRWIYLATPGTVYVAPLRSGRVGPLQPIAQNLPATGRHRTRSLGFGPPGDGRLYISLGSTGNANLEDHPWSAAILRADADGSNVTRFAAGLRNTVGFDWHPVTRQMWGMDHGIDWLGDTVPPEELNLLLAGRHYGWPLAYGRNELTPTDIDPGVDVALWRSRSTPMARGYHAHAAPLGFVFYDALQFPTEYRGDAFVAFHGSWNRGTPVGYEVVRIDFDSAGRPVRFVPFLSGFLQPGPTQFGRPAGVAVAPDGSLLVGDDSNGMIYRVRYAGAGG